MVLVEKLSKYARFVTLKHPFTTTFVGTPFLDNAVKLHNVLLSIISNRYKIFNGELWKELIKSMDNDLHFSKKYHPQTDDQKDQPAPQNVIMVHGSHDTPK
jgi:hypothetical protein